MEFEAAWKKRLRFGAFDKTNALRIFHGPGEGIGNSKRLAIDHFANHYWLTWWGTEAEFKPISEIVKKFLINKNAESAVIIVRHQAGGVPNDVKSFFGKPPEQHIEVFENECKFLIKFTNTKHPGLFLDHAPLRDWLRENCRSCTVLNCFSYTGSLSVAAGIGKASKVVSLDLANSYSKWSEENWKINQLPSETGRFISGDVFEWLPRFIKKNEHFDCCILDPPSFSRGKKGSFSTAKDLTKLHELAINVLKPNGILITSINSAEISWFNFEKQIISAAEKTKSRLAIIHKIEMPSTFPTLLGVERDRYLKGFILTKDS